MKKNNIMTLTTLLLATAMWSGCEKKSEFTYKTAEAVVQDITTSVTATGTIEPVTSVTVGTQVSGIVSKLYVDYNSIVKAGDVIAELDRTNLMSELSSAKASLNSAQSELDYQKANHERYKTLHEKGLISANEYEQVRLSFIKAQQTLTNHKENVKKAQTNLGYATITSPIDGVVLSKAVEEGQTVASSFNTPTLFTIAKDLTDMRVIANVDEAASLVHGMMLNNFTCGVFRVSGDAAAFADAMYGKISTNPWMCGMPEKMIIAIVETEYVIACFGINDAMDPFEAKFQEAYPAAQIAYNEAIA